MTLYSDSTSMVGGLLYKDFRVLSVVDRAKYLRSLNNNNKQEESMKTIVDTVSK